MSSTGGGVLPQVSRLWDMLDDLSQSDPEAYRNFIGKQMKAGAEFMVPPKLHSCLCTQILEPQKGLLYVNVCSWKRVPAPQDPSQPLPVHAGNLETDTNEGQSKRQSCRNTVLDVAFNPAVLHESEKDKTEMNQIYMLVLSFAQQQHGLTLSHQYTIVSCSPKSSPDDLCCRLGFQKSPAKQPDTASQTPADLLQQISSLCSKKQDKVPADKMIYRPAEHKKTGLIQVISSTNVQPQKPEYRLEVKTDTTGGPCKVELTVDLPKVCSVSECQLRISEEDLLLEVEDIYHLLLEFPKSVKEDTAVAIFNKQNRRLTVRVDIF
ncbi:PIH1 domain-containing protein 2 [Aulostomus maculatus]